MFFIGKEFDPDSGGYRTLVQARRQAEKKGLKVFEEDGTQVYPEPEETVTPAEITANANDGAKVGKDTTGAENPAEAAETGHKPPELTDDVPPGALDTAEDGGVKAYNDAGEVVGTVDAKTVEAAQRAAGAAIIGHITVVRAGLLAVRNAPKWETGHKCGVVKKGYTAPVVEKITTSGGPFYKTLNGLYISGNDGDTVFTSAE